MRAMVLSAMILAGATVSLPAQALPFHTETALTTAFEEHGFRTFIAGQGRGDTRVVGSPLVLLPFAPHQSVTTKVVIPITYKRNSRGPQYSNAGIGDIILAAKWAFFVNNRRNGTTRLAVATSLSVPTGPSNTVSDDGSLAPRPLQLGKGVGSGAVTIIGTTVRGPWGFTGDVGHVRSAATAGFKFGATTRYDLAIGFRLPRHVETIRTRTVQFYLEWNGAIRSAATQGGVNVPNTGGHVAYVSPGVQWVVFPQLLLETSIQVPVVQNHNGTQPDFGIRPAIGVRFLFF